MKNERLRIAGFALLFTALLAWSAAACTPAEKAIAKTVLDASGAECQELDSQDEPEFIKFTCSVIEKGSPIASIFLAKVKRADAAGLEQMRARVATKCPKCPACGGGSVSP